MSLLTKPKISRETYSRLLYIVRKSTPCIGPHICTLRKQPTFRDDTPALFLYEMTSEKQNEHGNQFHTDVTVVTRSCFLRLSNLKYSRIQVKCGVKSELVIKVGNELHYTHYTTTV